VFGHRAGVPAVDGALTSSRCSLDPVVAAIARSGRRGARAVGYHRTTADLADRTPRHRQDARPLLANEIAAPLGADFGGPPDDEPRVATLIPSPPLADPDARALSRRSDTPSAARSPVPQSFTATTCGTRERPHAPRCRRRTGSAR
jgi:hypothetical protein